MNKNRMKKIVLSFLVVLGVLCVVPGVKTEAKSKVSYSYKTTTKTYKASDGKVILKATYKAVKFKGSSSAIKKMNAAISKEKTQFFKNAKSNVEIAQSGYDWWKEDGSSYSKFSPSTMKITSKVTFNKNGIVSVKEQYDNYFYGAPHGSYYTYGQTFKISTGKKLTLNQVIKGSNTSDKKKLVAKFQTMYNKEPDRYWENAVETVKGTNMSKASFYLGSKYAVVCYAPYVLGSFASGETYVKLPHAFK